MRMNREERRSHLIRAALSVARHQGFAQVTTRAVAQEAKISLGVVHYCFSDKEELLYEMASHAVDEMVHVITKSVLSITDQPTTYGSEGMRETLCKDAITVVDDTSADSENFPLMYEIISYAFHTSDIRFQQLITNYYDALCRLSHSYLDSTARRYGVTWAVSLDQLVPLIVDLMHGYILRHLCHRTPHQVPFASRVEARELMVQSLWCTVDTVVRNVTEPLGC